MKKPIIKSVRVIGSYYEAIIECRGCGNQFPVRFTAKSADIKMHYHECTVAEIYAEKTAPNMCGECAR